MQTMNDVKINEDIKDSINYKIKLYKFLLQSKTFINIMKYDSVPIACLRLFYS